jgi:hypothetical protein
MSVPRIVVDRIEGTVAVLQVGEETVHLPVSVLPDGAGEGSVLLLSLAAEQPDLATAKDRLNRLQAASGISDDFTF